jgi:hypothetical protein
MKVWIGGLGLCYDASMMVVVDHFLTVFRVAEVMASAMGRSIRLGIPAMVHGSTSTVRLFG